MHGAKIFKWIIVSIHSHNLFDWLQLKMRQMPSYANIKLSINDKMIKFLDLVITNMVLKCNKAMKFQSHGINQLIVDVILKAIKIS